MAGVEPRIRPGSRRDVGSLNALIAAIGGRLQGTEPLNLFSTLARHRRIFRPWLRFAGALTVRGALPAAERELVILRVAHNCDNSYERAHHVRLARRAGLTHAEIERVPASAADEAWSERQALLLEATDELHTRRAIDDPLWKRLQTAFGERELIELCMLVGHYEMIAMTIASLAIQPDRARPRAASAAPGTHPGVPAPRSAKPSEPHTGPSGAPGSGRQGGPSGAPQRDRPRDGDAREHGGGGLGASAPWAHPAAIRRHPRDVVQPLAGQRILITGAARGIGAALARRLHARGAKLALLGIEPELLATVARECGDALAIPCDVRERANVDAAVAQAAKELGGIDVVIANAGVAAQLPLVGGDPSVFEQTIAVNLLGAYYTLRAAGPHIAHPGGYALAISSLAAALHPPLMGAYSASKAGVEALANALRIELAQSGARVGVAYFAELDTDMTTRGFGTRAASAMSLGRGPLGRVTPLAHGLDAIERGICKRSRHIVAPGWVAPLLPARMAAQRIVDRATRRGLGKALAIAREEHAPLTTAQPDEAANLEPRAGKPRGDRASQRGRERKRPRAAPVARDARQDDPGESEGPRQPKRRVSARKQHTEQQPATDEPPQDAPAHSGPAHG